MTPAQIRKLHRLQTQGLGIKPIARRLGVYRDTVRHYARGRGLAFPPPYPPRPPLAPALEAHIRHLHTTEDLGRRRIFRRLAPMHPALTLWQVDLVLNPWQRTRRRHRRANERIRPDRRRRPVTSAAATKDHGQTHAKE